MARLHNASQNSAIFTSEKTGIGYRKRTIWFHTTGPKNRLRVHDFCDLFRLKDKIPQTGKEYLMKCASKIDITTRRVRYTSQGQVFDSVKNVDAEITILMCKLFQERYPFVDIFM